MTNSYSIIWMLQHKSRLIISGNIFPMTNSRCLNAPSCCLCLAEQTFVLMSSWTVTLYQEASELNTNFILYTFRALYFLMQLFMSRKDKAPELLSGLYLTTLFTQLILLKTLNECLENNRALQYRGKIRQGWENTMYLLLRSIVLLFFFLVNLLTTKTKKI